MDAISIRRPELRDLPKVQQLRHLVLDPARLVDIDHRWGTKDFDEKSIHVAAVVGARVVGAVHLDFD